MIEIWSTLSVKLRTLAFHLLCHLKRLSMPPIDDFYIPPCVP